MRRIIAPVVTAAVAFAMLAAPAAAGNRTINWGFGSSGTVVIAKGNTITWNWSSGPHNVVGPGFRSGGASARGHFAHRFASKGTFTVYCAPHSGLMRLTVKVR
jgi:plastocyanin